MLRLDLVCARRGPSDTLRRTGLPEYIGIREIQRYEFPRHTVYEDKGEYVTAFFTTANGRKREVDIIIKGEYK